MFKRVSTLIIIAAGRGDKNRERKSKLRQKNSFKIIWVEGENLLRMTTINLQSGDLIKVINNIWIN